MSKNLQLLYISLVLLLISLSVCPAWAEDSYPRTLTDMAGRTVTIDKPIERIISNNPDNSRIVIALGEGDKLVGADECTSDAGCVCPMTSAGEPICDSCWNNVVPDGLANLPLTNDRYTPNMELMTSLKPDLILVWTSWEDQVENIQEQVGVPVFVAGTDFTIDDMKNHITAIGEVLGKQQEAEELAAYIDDEVKKVTDITDTIPEEEKPRVYFAPRGAKKGFYDAKEGRDFTRTVNTYDPLTLAGGINVAKDVADGDVNVALEQIIAWNPDVIMVTSSSSEDTGVDFILNAPELQSIKAIQEGKVYNVLSPHCRGRPHDKNLINMFYMAKLLYPDKFKDIDIEDEGNAIMKKFLGVDGVFTAYLDDIQFPNTQQV